MQKVRIVTDSVSDLPPRLAADLGVRVVPAYVHFGLSTYRDGVDLSEEEFYAKLASERHLPKTSQPSPADFYEAYKEASSDGQSIVSIQPTSELSGTYQSACIARASLPDADIEVIDTRTCTMAQGLLVIEAARAAMIGLSKSEIIKMVRALTERVRLYVLLDSLDFIARSGRVGKAKLFIAGMLNIKPIITVAGGIVQPLERVRGASRVIPRLVDLCQDAMKSARVRAAVIHASAVDQANQLRDEVERRLSTRAIVASAGPAIVTNGGPGSFGVAVMSLPKDHPVGGDL